MIFPHKQFYFVRHGETDWNRRHLYMGTKDIPLNQLGIEQAKLAGKLLKNEPIKHIASSYLSRATETAEIIASTLKKPITIIDGLQECCVGIREGEPVEKNDVIMEWLAERSYEGAEKINDFEDRIMRALKKAFEFPEPVLIVSHGGVYCAIQKFLGLPYDNIKNCEIIYHKPPTHPNEPWLIRKLSD